MYVQKRDEYLLEMKSNMLKLVKRRKSWRSIPFNDLWKNNVFQILKMFSTIAVRKKNSKLLREEGK